MAQTAVGRQTRTSGGDLPDIGPKGKVVANSADHDLHTRSYLGRFELLRSSVPYRYYPEDTIYTVQINYIGNTSAPDDLEHDMGIGTAFYLPQAKLNTKLETTKYKSKFETKLELKLEDDK